LPYHFASLVTAAPDEGLSYGPRVPQVPIFLLHKRPNIFNVLAITRLRIDCSSPKISFEISRLYNIMIV
ncbi:MAG: hypothetical protein NTZ95_04720, partial [Candidatus Omnitrophica bacterium]|nr:hypothetical protein [Candidatus Omnitrophota bacterium]